MTTEEAVVCLECMAIDMTGRMAGLSDMSPMKDLLERRIEAINLAQNALRAQQERENPKPLTLDELLEMGGEPVWCVDGSGNGMWGLVDIDYDHVDVIDSQCGLWRGEFYNMAGDGENGLHRIGWLAYRHKPKEESK